MTKAEISPASPEELFAEYRALRAEPAATREQYDALANKTRAAKAAWKKRGDTTRSQQLADLQNYIAQFKPADAELLTRESCEHALAALRTGATAAAVRALWQRLMETRAQRSRDPRYDEDHDDLVDCEGALGDLASELGISLDD